MPTISPEKSASVVVASFGATQQSISDLKSTGEGTHRILRILPFLHRTSGCLPSAN